MGEKNFSGPCSTIWRVWKWVKNGIFVEVVQKIQKIFFAFYYGGLSIKTETIDATETGNTEKW